MNSLTREPISLPFRGGAELCEAEGVIVFADFLSSERRGQCSLMYDANISFLLKIINRCKCKNYLAFTAII